MATKVQTRAALGAFVLGAMVSIAYRCDLLSKRVTGLALVVIGTSGSAVCCKEAWGARIGGPDPDPRPVNPGPRPVDDHVSDEESDSDLDPVAYERLGKLIELVPSELWLHVFFYCEARDLVSVQQVNQQWRNIGADHSLWKHLWQCDFPQLPPPGNEALRQDYLVRRLTHNNIASGAIPREIVVPDIRTVRMSWSPCGQRLIARLGKERESELTAMAAYHESINDSEAETINLYQAGTWEHVVTLDQALGMYGDYHCAPDGRRIAVQAAGAHAIQICSVESGAVIISLSLEGRSQIRTVVWSPDSQRLITTSGSGLIYIWETENWTCTAVDNARGNYIAWAPDGERFVVADGMQAMLYAIDTGQVVHRLTGHTDYVVNVAWSPDGRQIATGTRSQAICIWDAETGICIKTLASPSWVKVLSWSPDGSRLLGGSQGHGSELYLWDTGTWERLAVLKGHMHPWAHETCWSPDSFAIAMRHENGMRIWLAETGAHVATVQSPSNYFHHVSWTPDRRSITTVAYDGQVRLYDFSPEI